MRLALVTATPPTVPSGSGTFVATEVLARELEARGHAVHILRPARSPDRWPGLAFHRHAFNFGLTAGAAERETDVIVGFDMDGWTVAGHTRTPFLAYLHGVLADEATFEQGVSRWSLQTQAWAERRAAQRAKLVLATSDYSRRRIEELYGIAPGKIRIVQPGIDLKRWQQALAHARSDGRQGPTVLAVAHMYPRKNLSALFRAVAQLRDVADLKVRLVGDGPERRPLERLAGRLGLRGVVTFLGHVSFESLAEEYAACSVFCLPSLQEGFGLVFVEAMAAGKPVVALAAGAVPELVTDGVHGLLTPPHDDRALASALRRVLTEPALRTRMADVNRARASEFTAARMAELFLEAVMPLVSSPTHHAPRTTHRT